MTSWEQYFSVLHLSHRVISQPGFGSCRSSLVLDASQLLSSQITQLDDARYKCTTCTTTRGGMTRVWPASHPSSCHCSRTTLVHKPPKELGVEVTQNVVSSDSEVFHAMNHIRIKAIQSVSEWQAQS